MKLFLMHENDAFEKQDIARKAKITTKTAQRELGILEKAGLIKKRIIYKDGGLLKNGKPAKKKKVQGYLLYDQCPYITPLRHLLCGHFVSQNEELSKRLHKAGKIKVLVVSGVFLEDPDGRIDLLIAGESIKLAKLKAAVESIESEIGTEVKYAVFTTEDFKYRLGVCDRLVRDVFDYPHRVIVDRIGLE